MTWLKLSDDFGDECADLSDAAFRTHVEGLLWTMRRETDGAITARDLSRFAESENWRSSVDELVAQEFWLACDNGYLILHHMVHQPESEVLARRRELTAERVRKHRRRRAGLDKDASNAVTPRVTPSATERVTRDGSGRDGTGNLSLEEENSSDSEVELCSACGQGSGFTLVGGLCRRCKYP